MTPQPLGEIHCSTTEHIPVTRRRWLGWSLALAAAPSAAALQGIRRAMLALLPEQGDDPMSLVRQRIAPP